MPKTNRRGFWTPDGIVDFEFPTVLKSQVADKTIPQFDDTTTGEWQARTLTAILDAVFGTGAGGIATRGASTWSAGTALAGGLCGWDASAIQTAIVSAALGSLLIAGGVGSPPSFTVQGSSGQVLSSLGSGAVPAWRTQNRVEAYSGTCDNTTLPSTPFTFVPTKAIAFSWDATTPTLMTIAFQTTVTIKFALASNVVSTEGLVGNAGAGKNHWTLTFATNGWAKTGSNTDSWRYLVIGFE